MSSYQRVALFVFFDSIEQDLSEHIRQMPITDHGSLLTLEETRKATAVLERRSSIDEDLSDPYYLLSGLDLGEKFSVLMRNRKFLDLSAAKYFGSIQEAVERSIPTRNAVMHGRPLTTIEFMNGFALADDFIRVPRYWPNLSKIYKKYAENPEAFIAQSVTLLDDSPSGEVLNNLPIPDYDDTGFLPRPDLEKELKKKILGRHPVITVLGEGGNGKTALTLQTLYGLLASNNHGFDAIVWATAKSMRLGSQDIEKIEGAITSSLGLFSAVANQFEPGDEPAIDRVTKLLAENKILLVIDNLETILDESIRKFATDIPGESKLVFTSRVPLGSDLSVHVGDFSETEARNYLRRLGETYSVPSIKGASNEKLDRYARQLGKKPLLLKWFCLGVASGLSPEAITSKVDIAIKFCLENVINQLTPIAKKIACVLAVLPSSASAPLIHEIADLSSAEVEIGVAELIRFALVQRQEKSKFEVSYQLGGFSKTHIVRVLQPTTTFSEDALKKFRSVEGAFQNERRAQNANRYSFRYFAVRNRTEMLVSKKLKKIAEEANEGDIATAEELLQEVKSLSSEYFEVHRMDAFVAIKAQDVARAKASYQTAIELAEKQPQLHYFYAGMLSRYMSDFDAAADQLKTALDLDPNAPCVLQELARVACFRYDFPTAHYALEKMQNLPFRSNRDKIIHADLCTQVHYREADHLVMNGNISDASRPLRLLSDTISKMDSRLFDEKHVEHLYKALILVSKLKREIAFEDGDLLCELEDKIQAIKPLTQPAK